MVYALIHREVVSSKIIVVFSYLTSLVFLIQIDVFPLSFVYSISPNQILCNSIRGSFTLGGNMYVCGQVET